jgi:DNA-directed RNA polymerase subunit K/omega
MKDILSNICPHSKIYEVPVEGREGPVQAVSLIYDHIDDDKEVIISYCDYGTYWNYEEFLNDTRSRNADGAIVDVMHKTMPFMTKYEKTRILGQRAKQLNQGAQPLIPVDKKIIDGYLIAQLELQQKALPFIIRRPLPGGKSEYWRVSDLELI